MSRPKLLDLFCCEGGASKGYARAGFDVYGLDLFEKFTRARYPFPSHKGDAILALARGLSVETTAEGVENEREAAVMRALGCDQLQGYLFGRPVPAEELGEDAGNIVGEAFSRGARAL